MFLVSAVGSAYPEIGVGSIGGTGADAIWAFNIYRMIGGIAVGVASMIAPTYVGEFAPSAVRGQLGAYQQIAITGGMTIAYCVNWGITLQGDEPWVFETGWRGTAVRQPDAGAGLGLAIVRGVADAHRGSATVRNAASGCVFQLTLPLAS